MTRLFMEIYLKEGVFQQLHFLSLFNAAPFQEKGIERGKGFDHKAEYLHVHAKLNLLSQNASVYYCCCTILPLIAQNPSVKDLFPVSFLGSHGGNSVRTRYTRRTFDSIQCDDYHSDLSSCLCTYDICLYFATY